MKIFKILILISSAIVVTGCATSRATINIAVPEVVNSGEGHPVFLRNVSDNREFQIKPRKPNIPSLKNGEINNKSITSRAFARKRNGYGMAMGDILLPQGETVAGLVRSVVANALRGKGYNVVSEAPADGEVPTLDVEIVKLWCWFNPGFWAISTSFESTITLNSEDPKLGEKTVSAKFRDKAFAAGEGQWRMTVEAGLARLGQATQTQLD